jgi:hypothetical protein
VLSETATVPKKLRIAPPSPAAAFRRKVLLSTARTPPKLNIAPPFPVDSFCKNVVFVTASVPVLKMPPPAAGYITFPGRLFEPQ